MTLQRLVVKYQLPPPLGSSVEVCSYLGTQPLAVPSVCPCCTTGFGRASGAAQWWGTQGDQMLL